MTPSQVVEHVKQKDWNIAEQPGTVGVDAGPALLPLLNDQDSQVRQLAVTCLNAAGGPSARQGLLKALRDRTDTVRAVAARFLQGHFTVEDVPILHRELSGSSDEYVREQIALLLGILGTEVHFLETQIVKEKDEHARHAMSLALTRLGEAVHRQELIGRLQQNEPAERVSALRDLPYVSDRRLLVYVLPLLDDTRPGMNVGPSHGRFMIRVCDVAVNVASELLGGPFPWVEHVKRYSPRELQQAKMVLAGIR
ncbi:MAG TPA: HEAT repeat domain-containing protein [Candidatus Acidoferrales bacterium]|jgi:HEAT repeat protein|nr:HEAT repeat domain-containing protein [Candidatus Acidoferrales bacterium]